MTSLGLVLSGGGSRAAYQAGVLAAIAEIADELGISQPFDYYTGVSAGAMNIAMLASTANCSLNSGSKRLIDLWGRVESQQVYVSDPLYLSIGGLRWLADLSSGGMKKAPRRALLDTDPLKKLISDSCDFENIQKNIAAKKFRAIGVSALDYFSTSTVTFIQGPDDVPMWQRVRRRSEKCVLTADHILASSSIPMLFPPVTIEQRHFGDGSIRNHSPCGPIIYMGARKVIAIGVRKKQDVCYAARQPNGKPPTAGRILNVLLHALMMDGLEIDIERMERINANLSRLSERELALLPVKPIEHLWISPSQDISEIASHESHRLPWMVRYLLRGLGSMQDASEIASFLLFDPSYCGKLIEIGFEDGMQAKEQIQRLITLP